MKTKFKFRIQKDWFYSTNERPTSRIKILLVLLTILISASDPSLAQFPGSTAPTTGQNALQTAITNYQNLMANPDTALASEKKHAQRWMSYVFPYLENDNGQLSNEAYSKALRASMSDCGSDQAAWISDGPINMPDWELSTRRQAPGGWTDGVYNHPESLNVFLAATRTSGIMRSTDGGVNWNCVTDGLAFPVLGTKAMKAAPTNPDSILVITGTEHIKGQVIYSSDAGQSWDEVTQILPQFHDLAFHPSVAGLVFATSYNEIYYSTDYGMNWTSGGTPANYDSLHKHFWKIIVAENRLFFNVNHIYNGNVGNLYRGDFTQNGTNISITFSGEISASFIPDFDLEYPVFTVVFSRNVVNGQFYILMEASKYLSGSGINADYDRRYYTFRTTNGGADFNSILPKISPGVNTFELLVSPNDPDVFYQGRLQLIRYRAGQPASSGVTIHGMEGNSGNHDDYRSSQILSIAGQDRLIVGHDGGVGLVPNGLVPIPLSQSLNGNLSTNLIHAFDVHERTKRAVFSFQDHFMITRDPVGTYSERFIQEGSFALVQQDNPEAIVGSDGFGGKHIRDRPVSPNKIVANQLNPGVAGSLASGRVPLVGYQVHYRHHPERFAMGIESKDVNPGGVAMSLSKLNSVISEIPGASSIGPVAVCERDVDYLYAAVQGVGVPDILYKSINNGLTWTNLSALPLAGGEYPGNQIQASLYWRGIRALAVNHHDPNLLYAGVGHTYEIDGLPVPGVHRVVKFIEVDGVQSFIDYSEGLPAIPVERLLTIDSDNELIFCGTSAGVYYRTATMNQWECFSEGLPKVQITGMKYNYCDNELYVSTFGRGLWKTPVNLPINSSYVYEINQNTLWDTDRVVHNNVRVKAGFTLTITADVEMGNQKSIVVEPNARLIVDGGHITNFCSSMWAGIIVEGNSSQHQYPYSGGQYHQGRAIFKNNAIIENASVGVRNWNPANWGIGGIIQATNTTFKNCWKGAEYMEYQNFYPTMATKRPEKGFFRTCDFLIDDGFLRDQNASPPSGAVTLWRTDRLTFTGCTFINEANVNASENRVKAIYSHDANYIVQGQCIDPILQVGVPCQTILPSTFTGWHKAIEATQTMDRAITVRNSVFDKNMIGVEINGAAYSQIYDNEFNLGGHEFESALGFEDWQNHLGVYVNKTLNYSIEDNDFERPVDNAPYDGHGVLVFNSLGAENQVYKNRFKRLKVGANGWQVNRNTQSEGGAQPYNAGLQFLCNTNTGNTVDFEISRSGSSSDLNWNDHGIRLGQGSLTLPMAASNSFSASNTNPLVFTHFTINSYGIYGYFHNNSNVPSSQEIGPGAMGLITVNTATNCPSNFTTSGGLTTGKTELTGIKTEFDGLDYTYRQIIDDGNTSGMVTEIELTWAQNAWDLRDQLMLRAPYNSETVLIAAIQRNIMPHPMLLEVLLANPDALRSGNVIRQAETVPSPPMPTYMIDLLWASRDQTTLRTSMESTLADLHLEVQRLQKKIMMQKAFADSTYSAPDSTLYYLKMVKTVEGNYSRAGALAARHQYSQSIALLDSMQLNYKLSNERYAEMTALKNLYGLISSAHGGGKSIANLSASEIAGLQTIAESPTAGIAANKAQNALCFHYQICYDAQGQPKNMAAPRHPKPTYEELVAKLNTANAYPNPSDQYVTISYTLLHAKGNTNMQVFDNLGRQIENRNLGEVYEGQQLIDTRKLANGVYFFQIVQEGNKLSDGKFVVTH